MEQKNLEKMMAYELLKMAKRSDVSPRTFMSALGSTFLNIGAGICDALGYSDDMKKQFMEQVAEGINNAVRDRYGNN